MPPHTPKPPPRVRTRLEHDERRTQILSAARALFSERDYQAVSSSEIATAAGVSRGLLNHYFGTKRDLYLEVMRELMAVPPVPVPEYVEGSTVEERVHQSVDGWLEPLQRNAHTWLTAVEAAGSGRDPELESLLDTAREKAVARIVEVTGLGPLARVHPEVRGVLRGFSGMAETTTREWLRGGRLSRRQAHVLLETTLLTLIRETLPKVLAAAED
ncbi:MAG: TetR/AcrR family transcriptional regulator [Micromonosporaceae bacterium]